MTMRDRFWALAIGGMLTSVLLAGDVSDPVHIMLEPENYYLWHTATGAIMRLEWDLPSSAEYADLVIEGAGYHDEKIHITECHADVSLPEPKDARSENVYRFTLNFSDGTSETASLGLVRGHTTVPNGEVPSVRCRLSAEGASWTSAPKTYVIPMPNGAELSVNGEDLETHLNGGAGWYAVGPIKTDTWTSLSLAGDAATAVSICSRGIGHFVILR